MTCVGIPRPLGRGGCHFIFGRGSEEPLRRPRAARRRVVLEREVEDYCGY